MCAYSSPWGWWPLTAPLNLAFIHPFDAPTFRWRGVIWAGMATSKAGERAKREASCASPLLSAAGAEGLGSTPSDSWGGSLETVVVGVWQCLLGGSGAEDMEDCDMAPLRSPYKPSASNPAIANCIFCIPSVSSHCTSSLSTLALLSKCSPWKRKKKGFCYKSQA